MTYIKTVTEEEFKDILIDDYVNRSYGKEYYIIFNKDKLDLYDEPIDNSYKCTIMRGYWENEYREYCISSQTEYNDNMEGEDHLNEYELGSIIDRMYDDDEQYRDFISLAKDHLTIDDELMEIYI